MKILFSDFDGTLVHNTEALSLKNKEMMEELQRQGHLVVICTGRNIKEYQRDECFFHFPFDYLILNNGGHIVDKNYQTIYEKVIDQKTGIDILNHTIHYPHMWSFYCDGEVSYAYKDGQTYDHSLFDKPVDLDFFDLYQHAHHFQIICFHQDNENVDQSQKCFDYIKKHYHQQVEAYFNLHYVDVVPSECSKGTGIKQLLNMIQEPIEAIYAIGDSYNDLSMIEVADYGYTFVDAHEDIKKATQNHVHYVYEVIEDMLGGNKYELAR